ncbi:TetR family transcriptional regulator [Rhodococcoides yunnanense]|uniref:TetR family transcriptional regulator n=1 Tax=Rhodococcoides yunnanense TaxID=278209 RepID=UPI0009346AB8|nr:TetR family transcriptional regulator [Rhodococcus yunnanensis]
MTEHDLGTWREYAGSTLSAPLTAALSAFVEQGYHGTSVREIAGRAGLSVPGLYHHYPSKQALLVGLMTAAMEELLERSTRAEAEAGPRAAERFDAVVESLLLFHMHRSNLAFVGSTEIRSLEPANRTHYVRLRDEQQRMLDRIVLDGIASGDFEAPYPADASRAVTTMCVGVAGWYRPDGPLAVGELATVYLDISRRIVGAVR